MLITTREFLDVTIQYLDLPGPIYEFGSYLVTGQEDLANLRPLFPGKQYIGCDMRKGPGVDKVLNLHDIDLPINTAGTVLCFDTLEHVEYPWKAIEEIYRILRPGGVAIMSSLMNFPVHNYPHDYWRFTPEGFKSLLKIFDKSIVSCTGEDNFPITVLGIGIKATDTNVKILEKKLKQWRKQNLKFHRYIIKHNINLSTI